MDEDRQDRIAGDRPVAENPYAASNVEPAAAPKGRFTLSRGFPWSFLASGGLLTVVLLSQDPFIDLFDRMAIELSQATQLVLTPLAILAAFGLLLFTVVKEMLPQNKVYARACNWFVIVASLLGGFFYALSLGIPLKRIIQQL